MLRAIHEFVSAANQLIPHVLRDRVGPLHHIVLPRSTDDQPLLDEGSEVLARGKSDGDRALVPLQHIPEDFLLFVAERIKILIYPIAPLLLLVNSLR